MREPARDLPAARHHTVRWLGDDWERLEDAAQRLGAQIHIEITPTDIIRSATLKRVAEILNGESA